MKYLGVAYAGVIGVVAAAAIYLLEAPNAGPLVVSADVDFERGVDESRKDE